MGNRPSTHSKTTSTSGIAQDVGLSNPPVPVNDTTVDRADLALHPGHLEALLTSSELCALYLVFDSLKRRISVKDDTNEVTVTHSGSIGRKRKATLGRFSSSTDLRSKERQNVNQVIREVIDFERFLNHVDLPPDVALIIFNCLTKTSTYSPTRRRRRATAESTAHLPKSKPLNTISPRHTRVTRFNSHNPFSTSATSLGSGQLNGLNSKGAIKGTIQASAGALVELADAMVGDKKCSKQSLSALKANSLQSSISDAITSYNGLLRVVVHSTKTFRKDAPLEPTLQPNVPNHASPNAPYSSKPFTYDSVMFAVAVTSLLALQDYRETMQFALDPTLEAAFSTNDVTPWDPTLEMDRPSQDLSSLPHDCFKTLDQVPITANQLYNVLLTLSSIAIKRWHTFDPDVVATSMHNSSQPNIAGSYSFSGFAATHGDARSGQSFSVNTTEHYKIRIGKRHSTGVATPAMTASTSYGQPGANSPGIGEGTPSIDSSLSEHSSAVGLHNTQLLVRKSSRDSLYSVGTWYSRRRSDSNQSTVAVYHLKLHPEDACSLHSKKTLMSEYTIPFSTYLASITSDYLTKQHAVVVKSLVHRIFQATENIDATDLFAETPTGQAKYATTFGRWIQWQQEHIPQCFDIWPAFMYDKFLSVPQIDRDGDERSISTQSFDSDNNCEELNGAAMSPHISEAHNQESEKNQIRWNPVDTPPLIEGNLSTSLLSVPLVWLISSCISPGPTICPSKRAPQGPKNLSFGRRSSVSYNVTHPHRRRRCWRLLYKATEQGFGFHRFHQHSFSHDGKTLMLLHVQDTFSRSWILGVFVPVRWRVTKSGFFGTPETKILITSPVDRFDLLPVVRPNGERYIHASPQLGIGVGGLQAPADFRLHVDASLQQGHFHVMSNDTDCFASPKAHEFLDTEKDLRFEVLECEVYAVDVA